MWPMGLMGRILQGLLGLIGQHTQSLIDPRKDGEFKSIAVEILRNVTQPQIWYSFHLKPEAFK